MSAPPLELEGLVTRDLFVRAQSLHSWRTMLIGDVLWYVLIAGTIWLSTRSLWFAAGYAIPIAVIWIVVLRVWQRVQWHRIYRKSPYLHEPIHGALHDDRLVTSNSNGRNEMPWANFVMRKIGKDVVLLYQGPGIFQPLFREQFSSESDWNAAIALVKATTPPTNRLSAAAGA